MEEELKYIIESLLFVSEVPLPMDRLKKVLEIPEAKEIREALDALAEEYEARGGGFTLREVAGGYQIRTRPEYAQWIKRLIQPGAQRLSKAALETLAIVAYKQPIIRADIEFIRGVDCGGVLRMLLEKKLIRVLGRKEIAGRPMIYATTKQFLEIFDLKDLKDLPSPKEIEALGESHVLDMEIGEDEETQFSIDEENAETATESEDFGLDEIKASETEETVQDIEETEPVSAVAENITPDDEPGAEDDTSEQEDYPGADEPVPDDENMAEGENMESGTVFVEAPEPMEPQPGEPELTGAPLTDEPEQTDHSEPGNPDDAMSTQMDPESSEYPKQNDDISGNDTDAPDEAPPDKNPID